MQNSFTVRPQMRRNIHQYEPDAILRMTFKKKTEATGGVASLSLKKTFNVLFDLPLCALQSLIFMCTSIFNPDASYKTTVRLTSLR